MKKIEHIIWDWNGTILNDAKLCVEITNSMLKKREISPISFKTYSDIFDFPVIDYYRKIGFDFAQDSFEDLSIEFMAIYEKKKYECRKHSYFEELQSIIKDNNIKQSILSAYADDYLKEILSYHNILNDFTYISGLDNINAHSKIDNGKKLIEKIDNSKEKCIFIGDTIHDADTAVAMGIEYFLIPSGHNSLQRLKKRTDKVAEETSDILYF